MNLLSRLFGAYLLRRLFSGGSRRGGYGRGYGSGRGYGYGRGGYGYGRGGGSRRRGGGRVGFFGPFPSYSTRTRGGSRVTVSGCCLPIPLALALTTGAGARTVVGRRGDRA